MIFKTGLLPHRNRRFQLLSSPLLTSSRYYSPVHIDRRSELLTSNNQGNTQECVGYAIAGWAEYYRWKYLGIAEQIDASKIYERAKQIDGYPNEEGTTLEAGLQAAQDLKLLPPATRIREVSTKSEVKEALHRYGVVISSFMATDKWMNPESSGWMQEGGEKLGLHCVLLCGFSDIENPNYFSLQNSWGDIGWRGFVRMSPAQFDKEFQYGLAWDWKV